MTAGLVISVAAAVVVAVLVGDRLRKATHNIKRNFRRAVIGVVVGLAAWLYISQGAFALLGTAGVVAVVAVVALLWRRATTASTVTREGEKARRRSGVATPLQVASHNSSWAMHRKARAVRPHLRDLGWLQRWRTPTRELGVELCKAAGMRVWASVEDVILIVAGPRRGKTALLGTPVIDAPGAVVSTSTRTDLLEQTRDLRAKKGPVHYYNPGGLGDIESTIGFDPVDGCEDPTVAIDRAADMIPEKEGQRGESADWDAQSRRVLAALLHAAGLSRGTHDCHDVQRWAANPDLAAGEVQELLRESPMRASFQSAVEQFVTLNTTTRSSITAGILPALQWLHSPSAVASTRGGARFDVAALLCSKGTVYLLGRHEANTAPLLAALTGYIAREARRLAASPTFEGSNRGRLDPPLTLALDEAARVSPVPLPDWTGDFGGAGIQLILVFQSCADMVSRYGEPGSARIINNSNLLMYLGGNKAEGDLRFFSNLASDRDETVVTRTGIGDINSTSVRKAPVLSMGQLASLPKWKAVIYTGEMPIVIGRVVPVWKRHPSIAGRTAVSVVRQLLSRPTPAAMSTPDTPSAPVGMSTPPALPTPAEVSGAAPAQELTDVAY